MLPMLLLELTSCYIQFGDINSNFRGVQNSFSFLLHKVLKFYLQIKTPLGDTYQF